MQESPLIGWIWLWEQAAPWLMVVLRVAGLMVLTPLFSGANVPRRFRALLAVMLGTALYASIVPGTIALPPTDVFGLVGVMFSELMIGVSIGMVCSLPMLALAMAGQIMSYQMGFTVAQAYNPDLNTNSDALGQLLYFMGMAGFLATGGAERAFVLLAETFREVPVGAFVVSGEHRQTPVELFIRVLGSSLELAMRLSMPIVGALMVLLVALGFLMKTMPQINVMTVGFTIKIIAGLAMLALVAFVLQRVMMEEIVRVMDALGDWVLSLGATGAPHG